MNFKATPASWKPGQSGNPKGRPKKGYSIVEVMRSMLAEKPEIKQAIVTKLIKIGLEKDDVSALKVLISYMDGMPVQKQQIEGGDNGSPLVYKVVQETKPQDE